MKGQHAHWWVISQEQGLQHSPPVPSPEPGSLWALHQYCWVYGSLPEAFQIWREQKAPEGMGQWITKGKVWRGLPDSIDFCCCCCLGDNGLSQRSSCCHPWSLCVSGYECTEHEQWDAGVRTHLSSTFSLFGAGGSMWCHKGTDVLVHPVRIISSFTLPTNYTLWSIEFHFAFFPNISHFLPLFIFSLRPLGKGSNVA